MNTEALKMAKQRVPSTSVLVNMVSMRVHQLIMGHRPLVKSDNPNVELEDIALREIAEGKLVAEIDFSQASSSIKAT